MIYFVLTEAHYYTVNSLAQARFGLDAPIAVPPASTVTYDHLLTAKSLPRGTYVFGDIERLADAELVVAADLYRAMAAAPGCRVLNDPARVRFRYGLLRALFEAGVNRFDAHRADGYPRPGRFPVFVRAEAAHDAPVSPLLPDQAALDRTLAGLERSGRPLRGLIVVEYAAEPVAPGLFRRYGTFRVGERVLLDHVVTQDDWNVKWGKKGLATEDMYLDDERLVAENAHADTIRRAFDLAGIEYGRADFGLVDGQPQIYEINTNPELGTLVPHHSPTRERTLLLARRRLAEAFAAIDTPQDGPPVQLDSEALRAHRIAYEASPLGLARRALHKAGAGRLDKLERRLHRASHDLAIARKREEGLRETIADLKEGKGLLAKARRLVSRKRPKAHAVGHSASTDS